MKVIQTRAGFSLMEVNMAIFVMAIGILSMMALFPLGLRESIQGKQDLQQSMFADYALNQIVAGLSQTNVTWTEWNDLSGKAGKKNIFPTTIQNKLQLPGAWTVGGTVMQDRHYQINCSRVSARVMGIGVQSTDTDLQSYNSYSNNVMYYAEAMFQGDPSK